MNKLTAKKCREFIDIFKLLEKEGHLALASEYHLQAYEKALPALELQEMITNRVDQVNGWIEWEGGECPVPKGTLVDVRLRDGSTELSAYAWGQKDDVSRDFAASYAGWAFWLNEGDVNDIIAYRVVEQDRERGEEA